MLAQGYFEDSPLTLSFVASLVCGVIVVCIETPMDVVNTRLYNQGNVVAAYWWSSALWCLIRLMVK